MTTKYTIFGSCYVHKDQGDEYQIYHLWQLLQKQRSGRWIPNIPSLAVGTLRQMPWTLSPSLRTFHSPVTVCVVCHKQPAWSKWRVGFFNRSSVLCNPFASLHSIVPASGRHFDFVLWPCLIKILLRCLNEDVEGHSPGYKLNVHLTR